MRRAGGCCSNSKKISSSSSMDSHGDIPEVVNWISKWVVHHFLF
jgi:hypothetical protein